MTTNLRPAPRQDPYVLSPGEWWVGVHGSSYAAHHVWRGSSAELAEALNRSEAWTSTIGIGLMAGRSWRSGFGMAAGMETERSEQAYRYTGKWVARESTVTTQLVTLNSVVYASTTDTVTTEHVQERRCEGLDRRTVWRVPFEASWRTSLGRFSFGARGGVAAEFTQVRSPASLTTGATDQGIYAAQLDERALGARYPVSVVGVLGADLGYLLHERWAVVATPMYMRGLFSADGNSAVHASPERAGIRFQLRYIL